MALRCTLEDTLPPDLGACALQQSARYGAAMRAIGADTACFVWRNGSDIVGTAQVLHRRLGPTRLHWMPRGPVSVGPDAVTQMPFGRLTVAIPDGETESDIFRNTGFRALLTPQTVAELHLDAPDPDRLGRMHGKWRNRLRAAQAEPLTVTHRPFDPERHSDLLRIESAQRRRRGYRALPGVFTYAYANTKSATRLFLAHKGATLVAFMLFLLHPPVATYHIGWTTPEGRQRNAHNLLLWQASQYLNRKGFTRLDLGGLDTENASGLARFKLGSGAIARRLGPTMLRMPFLSRRPRAA